MAETTTVNFGWTKADPGASSTTWGTTINATVDKIDQVVYATQQAGVPVGTVAMFAGATAPANWLFCDGAVRLNTDIPLLAPILNNVFNTGTSAVAGTSTALPNFRGLFPLGAGPGSMINVGMGWTGGEANHALSWGETGAHYHNVPDPSHAHGAYQNAHAHNIATGGHGHNIHTGGHSHGLDHQVPTTSAGGTVSPQAGGYLFGNVRTDGAGDLGGYCDGAGNLGGNTDSQAAGVGIYGAYTGISTTDTQGSGSPHNNIPPGLAINFIIRYK